MKRIEIQNNFSNPFPFRLIKIFFKPIRFMDK